MEISKLQQILVYTDFTEVGDNAIDHAAKMSLIFKKQLTILHVIDDNTNSLFKKNTEEQVEKKLNELSVQVQAEYNLPVQTMFQEGCACRIINSTSEDIDAVMVVLGVHDKHNIQYITPKYALKKISRSRIPFLLVNRRVQVGSHYDNVILPLSHTKESKEKSNWAAYFGRLNQSGIQVLVPGNNDPKVNNNLMYSRKIFKKFDISHDEISTETGPMRIDQFAFEKYHKKEEGMLVMMTSGKLSLLDKIFGTRELRILNKCKHLPVLAIAPRDDLYVPCV